MLAFPSNIFSTRLSLICKGTAYYLYLPLLLKAGASQEIHNYTHIIIYTDIYLYTLIFEYILNIHQHGGTWPLWPLYNSRCLPKNTNTSMSKQKRQLTTSVKSSFSCQPCHNWKWEGSHSNKKTYQIISGWFLDSFGNMNTYLYCWWKKCCITQHVGTPVNNEIFITSTVMSHKHTPYNCLQLQN